MPSRYQLVQYILRMRTLPDAFREELLSWPVIVKSPHSRSFYNMKGKRWDHTPEGCLRLSDHWNFKSRKGAANGQIQRHCITDKPVSNNTHWALAEYQEGIWRVREILPMRQQRKRYW